MAQLSTVVLHTYLLQNQRRSATQLSLGRQT